MRKLLTISFCAFAAMLAFAAPKPAWVPADADFVSVNDNLDKKDAAADAAWKAAMKTVGFDYDATKKTQEQQFRAIDPQLPEILKAALGISDDWESVTAKSIVYSMVLPKKGLDFEKLPSDFGVYLFIENPKVDRAALDKAVTEAVKAESKKLAVTRKGEWAVVGFAGRPDEDESLPFLGYRAIPEGLVFALCGDDGSAAEALVTGKAPALAQDSPLMKAFEPIAGATRATGRSILGDLAALANRYITDPETRKRLELTAALLFKTHAVRFDGFQTGAVLNFKITAVASDEPSALLLRDQLIASKTMAAQMILPMVLQVPNSATAALLTSAVCEAKGKSAVLSLSVSPEQAAKVVKEMQELQARQAAQAANAASLDDDDEDDDDDSEPMTEEEARKVLDGLDAK